jgi:hypothetical protein
MVCVRVHVLLHILRGSKGEGRRARGQKGKYDISFAMEYI